MRKAEGIVVVASVPGKPVSEVEAQLELYGFSEFTTIIGDGVAGVFNRQLEMDNVLREVRDEITDVEFRIKWNDGTSTENYTAYRE